MVIHHWRRYAYDKAIEMSISLNSECAKLYTNLYDWQQRFTRHKAEVISHPLVIYRRRQLKPVTSIFVSQLNFAGKFSSVEFNKDILTPIIFRPISELSI